MEKLNKLIIKILCVLMTISILSCAGYPRGCTQGYKVKGCDESGNPIHK